MSIQAMQRTGHANEVLSSFNVYFRVNRLRERDALFDHLTLNDIVAAIEKRRGSQATGKALNASASKPAS